MADFIIEVRKRLSDAIKRLVRCFAILDPAGVG